MSRRAARAWLAVAALSAAPAVRAASIIPPENLGELAIRSDAIVLARAGAPTPLWHGQLLFTRTTFTPIEVVAGDVAHSSHFTVQTPGGELDGLGWAVAGSPRFTPGQVYLLFLHRKASGEWQPTMLSYGLLERVIGRDGSHLLGPLDEWVEIESFPRPDGILPEPVETYRETALLPHLAAVARGASTWDSRKVLAQHAQVPLRTIALAVPSGCTYLTGSPGARWPYNSGSPPGQVTISADSTGDPSISGGGFGEVESAINNYWMSVGTSLDLAYGGPQARDINCTNGAPPAYVNQVVFDDPCDDIPDLSGCSGTLAQGGPWYSGSHSFDGYSTWTTLISMFVVVNDGAGCLGSAMYTDMLAHEMGHGLGFGHFSGSENLMYFQMTSPTGFGPKDIECAQYTYPAGGGSPTPTNTPTRTPTRTPTPGGPSPTATPGPPPAPTGVSATDGTWPDRVRVSWSPVASAASYRVYRNTSSSTAGATQIGTPTGTLFDDLTAAVGTTYWYWVRSENGTGVSAWSASDTGFRGTGSTPTPTTPAATPTRTPTVPPGTPSPTPTVPVVPTATRTPTRTPTAAAVVPANVAVVAHNTGAQGTAWRSDVTLANPSDAALAVDLRYKASGGGVTTGGLSLAARETRLLGDVLVSFFGVGVGRGALQVVPPAAGPQPAVSSRTYNQTAAGNLGFAVVALVPPAAGTYYIPGLYADTVARTNLGITAGPTGTNATVTLYRGPTGQVASTRMWIGAHDQQQWAVQDMFPGVALAGVPMSVALVLDGAAHAYATQVDQASGDTVFLSGSPAATSWVVPVVAHNTGVDGTYWRSDLYLFNPNGQLNAVTLEYLPETRDNSGGGTASTSVTLGAHASQTIADLVGTRFGITRGKGSLAIRASRPVIAASRCYTTRALGGTLGFGAPAVLPTEFHTATRTLPGVRALAGYRTNIGLVTGASGANVTLRLRNANGTVLATNSTIWVPPRSLYQLSLADAFPGAAAPNPVGAVEVSTNAPLGAYLSVIDGSSQDPILVLAP